MAIRVQTEFTRKGDVRVIYYNYDDDEALVAATAVYISIIDPDGTVVVDGDTITMTATDTGIYEYYYATTTSTVEGDYQIEVDSLDGGKHSLYHGHFSISKGINE